jgi:hypothetical protein
MELLSSTIAGLLDGRHAAVPRPIRTRRGREIVDGLEPALPATLWPTTLPGSVGFGQQPEKQIGLVSAVVEIRLQAEPR